MWLTLTLLGIILYILTIRVKRERSIDYKCFLLTLPTSKKRKETFLKSYDNTIPLERIYQILNISSNPNITGKLFECITTLHVNAPILHI